MKSMELASAQPEPESTREADLRAMETQPEPESDPNSEGFTHATDMSQFEAEFGTEKSAEADEFDPKVEADQAIARINATYQKMREELGLPSDNTNTDAKAETPEPGNAPEVAKPGNVFIKSGEQVQIKKAFTDKDGDWVVYKDDATGRVITTRNFSNEAPETANPEVPTTGRHHASEEVNQDEPNTMNTDGKDVAITGRYVDKAGLKWYTHLNEYGQEVHDRDRTGDAPNTPDQNATPETDDTAENEPEFEIDGQVNVHRTSGDVEDNWHVESKDSNGKLKVVSHTYKNGKYVKLSKTIDAKELASWQDSEDIEDDELEETPQYNRRSARATQWAANRVHNNTNMEGTVKRLDKMAEKLEEESLTKRSRRALGKIGLATLKFGWKSVKLPFKGAAFGLNKTFRGVEKLSDAIPDPAERAKRKAERAAKQQEQDVIDGIDVVNEVRDLEAVADKTRVTDKEAAHTEADQIDAVGKMRRQEEAHHIRMDALENKRRRAQLQLGTLGSRNR